MTIFAIRVSLSELILKHIYIIRIKIKGLVHPKMKIKSLITHPHAVPTP